MLRLRFLRVLLPLVLLPFLVLLALQLRTKERVHSSADGQDSVPGVRAEAIEWSLFDGGRRTYTALVNSALQEAQERFRLEGVRRFEVERDGAPPLVISADLAGVAGSSGERLIKLQGGVEVSEEERGVRVSVAELEIDQASGEARSIGVVQLESPQYRGTAERVVYGLEGQPTRVFGLRMQATDGGQLTARSATLHDGTRDVELEGQVRLTRGREFLASERLRIRRDSGGPLRHAEADAGVTGAVDTAARGPLRFEAERVEVHWDPAGEVEALALSGRALLLRESDRIAASEIEARRRGAADPGWELQAEGAVDAGGSLVGGPSVLRADRLAVRAGPDGALEGGEAVGGVSFRGGGASGESARATFRSAPGTGEIVLSAEPGRRARLARGQTRVVADRIVTDRAGIQLTAEGRVEATLLPAEAEGQDGPAHGLFRGDEAIHFVAARLDSRRTGQLLTFQGNVRGWQGERTLSAERITVDQTAHSLVAAGSVATRLPRDDAAVAVAEQDFVQITAAGLDYSEQRGLASYTGDARIRQAEGWMQAERIEVELRTGTAEGIEQIRGFETVRFEYRTSDDGGVPTPVTGEGDRVVYTPAERLVRLFGDRAPATVRRNADRGGNASGRVLVYRLDVGSIQVESGAQDSVRIVTSGDSQ